MKTELALTTVPFAHDTDSAWVPRSPVRMVDAFHQPSSEPVEFCVVVPTYNERRNLDELVARVDHALSGVRWELIIVDDDSSDGTADHARAIHARDPRVRVIRRIGRRGLASACVEGMMASSARYLAVMDGDLQHDPTVLAKMLEILRDQRTDLVAASRYMQGGSIGEWDDGRAATSRFATRIAQAITPVDLSDPMSGFFAIRREVIDRWAPQLSAIGFKILLDLAITAGPGLRIREVPLRFACRQEGVSKFSPGVAWDFAMMIGDKAVGHIVPVQLLAFAVVGAMALTLHLVSMACLLAFVGLGVVAAQGIATMITLLAIFAANTLLSRKPHSSGALGLIGRLTGFAAACSVGAAASIAATSALSAYGVAWPLAAIAGSLAMLAWNYAATAHYSWRAA